MSLSAEEREVVIGRTMAENDWVIYCTDPVSEKFFRKLTEKAGGKEVQRGLTVVFSIPATQLTFSVKKKMNLSDEERQKRRDRLATSRSSNKGI